MEYHVIKWEYHVLPFGYFTHTYIYNIYIYYIYIWKIHENSPYMGVYSWGNHVTCGACSTAICLVTRRLFIREFGVQTPSRLYVRSTRDLSSCNLFTYSHILSLDTLEAIWISQPRGGIYKYT